MLWDLLDRKVAVFINNKRALPARYCFHAMKKKRIAHSYYYVSRMLMAVIAVRDFIKISTRS